jgi:LemA protein
MNPLLSLVILILVIVGVISVIVSAYNKLVMLKFNVSKAFANIDVLLKQRADEIPNLIKVVKKYSSYESGLLEKLTEVRTRFLNTKDTNEKVALSNEMDKAVKSIFAVSENYPDLKAAQSFTQLQTRVSDLENAISDRREFFNESVTMYNIGITEFPPVILAKLFGYKEKQLLEISEQEKQYNGVQF